MATRRMFSKIIVDSDDFLDMPVSARLLYYDLGMRADDDGFVNPKRVIRLTGAADDDLKILLAKKYVLSFEDKILVIRDWKVNNFIRPDRYSPTIYKEYLKKLKVIDTKQYKLSSGRSNDIPVVDPGKDRIGKVSKGKDSIGYTKKDKNLTDLLYKLVKENYPFLKEKDYSKDYAEMNKLNRIDKWTYEQIEYIIRWSQRDDFWKQNIRSVKKLRKQFENLVVRAKQDNKKGFIQV